MLNYLFSGLLLITDCGALNSPENVLVDYLNGTTYQSVATFECRIGYALVGDSTSICLANVSWSNNNTSCEINGKNSWLVRYLHYHSSDNHNVFFLR